MDDKGSRWLWLGIVLIVGFTLGYLFRGKTGDGGDHTPTPQPTAVVVLTPSPPLAPSPTCVPFGSQGNKNVVVGPDIQICNPDCLSIGYNDTVTWAGMTTDDLWIEFQEKPFKTMYGGTIKPNRADCAGNTCRSGPVGPVPTSGTYPCPNDTSHRCKDYKYYQVFHNSVSNSVADGRIIIKW
jgi:hypothetical protein